MKRFLIWYFANSKKDAFGFWQNNESFLYVIQIKSKYFEYFSIFLLSAFLVFRYFSLHTGSRSNSFLIMLLTFFQILLYFSNNFSSFIKKTYICFYQNLFYLYAFIFGRNIHRGLIFLASLQPIKYLKSFVQKETLLDTAILLISILSNEKGLLC